MFILADTPTFWWPAIARVPHPTEAGAVADQAFRLRFELVDTERLEEIEAAERAQLPTDPAAVDCALLRAVIIDWAHVVRDPDLPVAFTNDMLSAALRQPWFRAAAFAAYREAISGEAARLGN